MNQWKHRRHNNIVWYFLVMSSRCLNHTLQNCYKFRVVRGTAGIHTQTMFFFKNPPNAEIFPHPSWSSPRNESLWVGRVDSAPHEPTNVFLAVTWIYGRERSSLYISCRIRMGLAENIVLMQIVLEMYKILFWCFCFKKVYADSGNLSVMSILETRNFL